MPQYPDTADGCHTEVVFNRAMASAQTHYDELIASGMKPEDARGVLPNACHTEFIVTANFRAWYEFLQKRTDRAAQGEIREMSFEERLSHMLDNELLYRENKRLTRLLKAAKLREKGTMESLDYNPKRGLDKSMIASLSSCEWVSRGQNMIITGPTGAGKTWLACALGNQACRKGLKTKFFRLPLLLED